ncbi:hypothetical protein Nepgr_013531 [Nepenthes gracilis]|uniref:Uncharacterized protein n=1 Tax=Nepenthes gracilis TaxID=150966 RepID=A0AAD3SHN3_NEPGR|nr:hypothetical protein Nepgr_013531 [Nepenthes gracilis]
MQQKWSKITSRSQPPTECRLFQQKVLRIQPPQHLLLNGKSRAGFSKSSSSPGIEPTIRATSNQPEPDSNGYTNLHISRQIPLRSPTLGASVSSGSIQHSSKKTNTARSAPPIYLQLAARAAFQANSIVDPSESAIQEQKK